MTGKPNCFCSVSPFTIIIKQPPQEVTVELNLIIFMTHELNNLSKATTIKSGTILWPAKPRFLVIQRQIIKDTRSKSTKQSVSCFCFNFKDIPYCGKHLWDEQYADCSVGMLTSLPCWHYWCLLYCISSLLCALPFLSSSLLMAQIFKIKSQPLKGMYDTPTYNIMDANSLTC